MSKPKKASQEKNKLKKGRAIREDDGPKDFRQERDAAEYIKQSFNLNIRARKDYTGRQLEVLEAMTDTNNRMVILDALFGTGKSHLAVLAALTLLNKGEVDKILYCRSLVESSQNSAGFLKGELSEKQAPYMAVMEDKLKELLSAAEVRNLLETKAVDYVLPNFIRGRSYDRHAIIVDECSNLSFDEFVLIVSRCGKGSRIFFIGDDFQSDVKNSGFTKFFDAFYDQESIDNGVRCFELKEESDIVRSGFMKFSMIKLGVIKFGKTIRPGDERECAAPRDFMAGEVQEGDIIEKIDIEKPKPSRLELILNKVKFW